MAAKPLPQRVTRATGEGWSCCFTMMHLALKEWLRRKWSLRVLAGLPWASARLTPPREDTWRLGSPTLALGQARAPRGTGAGLPCPGREPGPFPHVGTPGTWAALPRAHSRTCAQCGQTWTRINALNYNKNILFESLKIIFFILMIWTIIEIVIFIIQIIVFLKLIPSIIIKMIIFMAQIIIIIIIFNFILQINYMVSLWW